ncbi:MAG TPA: hypothetical protein VFV67_33530 [Actinophytocola sp.]|uniref:hypothetical protein n=1 Tax=Actinophytocola sp. TaxID=1872138 RepID=UPI002DB72B41|nr:hypothetical protein [Actinophytocola sp.]HEU5475590.1 hypothetical protein [Actinophytocola sp.]
MAQVRKLTVTLALTGLLGGALVSAESAAGQNDEGAAIAASGRGSGTARLVDQRANPPAPPVAATAGHGPLGMDGKPPGAAAAGRPRSDKTAGLTADPNGAGRTVGSPNSNGPTRPGTGLPRLAVNANFIGIVQSGSGGTNADASSSVGTTQIMQTANGRVTVFNKDGTVRCGNTLAAWLGAGSTEVFSPRTLFDSHAGRFVIIASTPGRAGVAPRLFLAATTTVDACEGYHVYDLSFGGSMFPAGARLDFPYLGQDQRAILSSTNNFNPGYVGSAAWSVAKEKLYAGAPLDFPAFTVAFSAAPVTVTGIPLGPTTKSYFVAAVPDFGYRLYRMTNTAAAQPRLVLQASIPAAFGSPPRRVSQCPEAGESVLDPGDGRLAAPPVQAVNSPFIWYAHTVDLHGFPTVRYGVINTESNTAYSTVAFHGSTSDDFNPSIGAFEETPNGFYLWLNWAYTDTGATPCVSPSATMNAVSPGAGVPALINSDLPLVQGSPSMASGPFGGFSSVHVDSAPVGPPAARTAVLTQPYFVGGNQWGTRIARVSFVPGS